MPSEAQGSTLRACLIGGGRAGGSLALAWQRVGVLQFDAVFSRGADSAVAAGLNCPACRRFDDLPSVDVWVVATPDAAIADVAVDLSELGPVSEGNVAFHLSGAVSSEALAPLRRRGAFVASAHPVRSFPQVDPLLDFDQNRCALEGDQAAVRVAGNVFEAIGGRCFGIDRTAKTTYHAAAVLASNGVVALADAAIDAWRASGVPEDVARSLFSDLALGAAANVARVGPREALTGPLLRGDSDVVAAQLDALAGGDENAEAIYRVLSRRLLMIAGDRLDGDLAARLDQLLRDE